MNLVFEGFGRDERITEDRSTWFTPPDIALRMWRWSGLCDAARVLEPSAGSGNLVAAARASRRSTGAQEVNGVVASTSRVIAYEIDPYYVERLHERFAGDELVSIVSGSYLDAPAPEVRYDLGFANPPFEDGLDGEFLAKMLDECDRVIALVRLVALAGSERHRRVWSRIGQDWHMPGLAIFPARPSFIAGRAVGGREESGSAKADFCVVKLSRVGGGETAMEWWA